MAIHIEVYDHTQDFIKTIIKEPILVEDYFNFEFNDIDLNSISKILREGKYSGLLAEYSHLPSTSSSAKNLMNNIANSNNSSNNCNNGDSKRHNPEALLGKQEYIERLVYEDFKDIYSKISDCFLNMTVYPYYKNTVYDMIKYRISVYNNDEFKNYKQIHFFVLLLSKRKHILGKMLEFYKKKFMGNLENTALIGHQEGLNNLFPVGAQSLSESGSTENPNSNTNITNTLTVDILKSTKFVEFCNGLAKWYSLAETITLNLGILNDFFGFSFEFSQDKFSLNKNFDFSLKTFAKKSLLKLISYFLKKLTLNINFGEFNYKRILLVFASAFTCGIPLRDFLCKDIKQFALLGGVVFNILVSKIATNIENYSNTLEFSRLMAILDKLNKKLTIIEKKLYKILKSSLRIKLLNYVGVAQQSWHIEKMEERKKIFIQMLAKYLKGTENFNEEQEMSLLRESMILSQEVEKTIKTGKKIDETWVMLNLKNKENEENKENLEEKIDINLSIISEINHDFK